MCMFTKEWKITKETNNRWYNKQKRKKRLRGSEYANTKIWEERVSSFKNWIVYIANCKLISKI